jgi:hypothetical protein
MARDGLEVAARQGSARFGFQMVGNGTVCAIRTGDWEWAETLLAEWLQKEMAAQFYLELFVDRAIFTALHGGDPSADIGEAEALLPGMSDVQYASYVHWARAWAALCAGRLEDAVRDATTAVDVMSVFAPLAFPIAARGALWGGDLRAVTGAAGRIELSPLRGTAIALDLATIRAGVASIEGRRADAIAGYREVFRGWRAVGLPFDEALAVVDMATVLAPSEREMPEASDAIEQARSTLSRLGARPFLARLDGASPVIDEVAARPIHGTVEDATRTEAR